MRLPSWSSLSLVVSACLLAACYTDGSQGPQPGSRHAALEGAPGVSAERDLEPATYVLTSGLEPLNSLVYDGQQWVALRAGTPPRLSRINRDGQLLDPLGRPLYQQPLAFKEGALASDGTSIAAVWYGNIEPTQTLWFRRFDRALRPLGEPLTLSTLSRQSINAPHIAFGGGQYLVAWAQELNFVLGQGSDYAVFVMRISPDGVPLDAAPVEIYRTHASMDSAHVSWDGENFMVVWEASNAANRGGVLATRVTPAGEVLEDEPVLLASNVEGNDVCFANGVHTLVWATRGYTGDPPPDVFAVRVTRELALLDAAPIVVADGKGEQYNPHCTSNEQVTLFTWTDTKADRADLSGRGIAADGTPGSILRIAETGVGGYSAVLANDGERALALWRDGGSRINSEGPMDGTSIRVRQRTVAQSTAAVAVGPESALVTFHDERPFGPSWIKAYGSLRMQRVSFDGTPIDAVSTQLVEAKNQILTFWSASDGTGFLVAWVDLVSAERKQRLFAQRVRLDGVAAAAPTLLAQSAPGASLGDVHVARAQAGYLVTFGQGAVLAQRVSSDGAAVGTPFALSSSDSQQAHARVAFEGETDLVLWHDDRQLPSALWMTRVAADGSVLDPVGRPRTSGSVDSGGLQMVSIAGGAYAIWGTFGSQGSELHGTWFAHDGLTDQEEGTPLPVPFASPVLGTDGKRLTLLGAHDDALFAAQLDRKGALLAEPVPVSAGSHGPQALGVLPDGSALVVYARPDESDVAARIRVRKLDAPAQASQPDAGPADSGAASERDAGTHVEPHPGADSGLGSHDAAVTPDGGHRAHDAGAGVVDAGTEREDAGAPLHDAGTEPPPWVHDAGTQAPHDAGGASERDAAVVSAPRADAGSAADSGAEPPVQADGGATNAPAGDAGSPGDDTTGDGCSCRVTPAQAGLDRALWALPLFGYLARRRRKRSSAEA